MAWSDSEYRYRFFLRGGCDRGDHLRCVQCGRLVDCDGERWEGEARGILGRALPVASERLAKSVAIRLSTPPADRATFERLWDLFAQHKGDRRVAIVLHERDRHIRITVDVNGIRVRPSETLVAEVEKICGSGSVTLR